MPVVVHRPQPEMTTPQALAQQAQGLYARAASLLHGIAEEDEVDSPRSGKAASSISTCSSKEVLGQGKIAVGKAVMLDGKPPSKVGLLDAVFAANLSAAEKDDRLESLECRVVNADTEVLALRNQLRTAEAQQATQRTGFELQLATGDTKLRESQARCAALEAHQAVESVSSREACREEIAQALSGLRESHKRECEKASHLLTVANGEAHEEAVMVEFLRNEAMEQSARWGEDRESLLGESHLLQASLQECNNRLAGLELQVQHASESAAQSAREQVGEVEALALARAESSRVTSHAEAIEQEWRNDAEAHNATNALVEVELHGFEERIAQIQHEADQACKLAKAEARAEAAEAAEAVAKLRNIERERAEDVEAAFRMHADARQALEHLCHFVGRRQLGEDDVQALANAKVAAASAEAAGLREELHHHFHAQRDLRQELSALSSAAAAVHSATEAKDEIIMRLESKVSELRLQQGGCPASERLEEGLPVPLPVPAPQLAELESSGVPPIQRGGPDQDLAVQRLWMRAQESQFLERQESQMTDGDTPSVNNLGTWRSDVLTSSAGSVELARSLNSKPLIESSGSPDTAAPPDTPQLGTRELPDSRVQTIASTAAVTQLQQHLACCLPGEDALPSAVAAAAVTAVKAALVSLSDGNASKLLQNGDGQEARKYDEKAPSMCSTGSSLAAFESLAIPSTSSLSQDHLLHEEYEGLAQEQRNMTEELKSDISRLRRILFKKSNAFFQLEEDAKKLMDPRVASPSAPDPRVASPSGPDHRVIPSPIPAGSYPKSPDALSAPSFVAPNINQFVQGKPAEVRPARPDSMTIFARAPMRQHSSGDTPQTRDRTVSPHPRERVASTVSDSQPPQPVPHPIPHRRIGLGERFLPQTSCESLDTCTPLCRSQQTLPPDSLLDQTSSPGVGLIDQSNITVTQEAALNLEVKPWSIEIAVPWEKKTVDLAKQSEARGSAMSSHSTRARTPSPLRQTSPSPYPWRTIQASGAGKITARSIGAPSSATTPAAPPPMSPVAAPQTPGVPTPALQSRYTTPPPGRLTPTSSKQPMVQPPPSLPMRAQSHWQQRVNAACSIQTLEQTLQTLKLRAAAPGSALAPAASAPSLKSTEAPSLKPNLSSAAPSATMTSPSSLDSTSRSTTPTHTSSMPSFPKVGDKSAGGKGMLVTRQTTSIPTAAPQAMISGSSDGLRQVVRVASPLAKPMSERDCSPTRPQVTGRITATPRVSVTPPASGGHSVSPQTQRLPATPPGGLNTPAPPGGLNTPGGFSTPGGLNTPGGINTPGGRPPGPGLMVQRSRVCWQSSR